MNDQADLVGTHIRALNRLANFLAIQCADRTNSEMVRRLEDVFLSFHRLCDSENAPTRRENDITNRSSEGTFVTLQCSILLAFACEIQAISASPEPEAVRRILDALWVNLKGMYKLFLREDYHFALVKS